MVQPPAVLHEELLAEFDRTRPALEQERAAVELRLSELLHAQGLETALLSSRVKSPASLKRKLARPDRTYRSLWEVTDLIGLRVAVYFEDDLERLARAIEAGFEVDLLHSTDKLRFTDHGRFGYRSLHYVCAPPKGSPLPKEARFEIQVRTALQHAWAEVEHDLGSKANDEVPPQVHRRFARIASLLEIADQEFVAIRGELGRYRRDVEQSLADPERPFPLDVVSLASVAKSAPVSALDAELARALSRPLDEQVFFPRYLVKLLKRAGLATTREVLAALEAHRGTVLKVVGPYFEFTRSAWSLTAANLEALQRGYSLFFLAHVVLLKSTDLELAKVAKLTELYRELDYPDDEKTAQQVASGLIAALKPHLP